MYYYIISNITYAIYSCSRKYSNSYKNFIYSYKNLWNINIVTRHDHRDFILLKFENIYVRIVKIKYKDIESQSITAINFNMRTFLIVIIYSRWLFISCNILLNTRNVFAINILQWLIIISYYISTIIIISHYISTIIVISYYISTTIIIYYYSANNISKCLIYYIITVRENFLLWVEFCELMYIEN